MDLLLLVTNPQAGAITRSLARACDRAGIEWAVFFTNDGVMLLADPEVCSAVSQGGKAIACHESWDRYMQGRECPVELGSQTNNSELVTQARRIVSL